MIILIGASSGIGLRLINELIQYDDILATYNRKKINIKIKNKKNNLIIKKLDISKEKNIKKFVNDNSKILKRVTFLNLATISVDKLIVNLKSKDISRSFQINSFSNILFAKYLINTMIKNNFGRFVFFSSTRASRGDTGISLYSSSKSMLKPFSKCISKEFGRFNITSNVISLGYFDSPLLNNINTKIKEKLLNQIPSKKIGKTKNISNIIKAIIKSDYINAAEIKIDGGL
jgi:3-oxoacyl-[acyl-carrier protein] reductase